MQEEESKNSSEEQISDLLKLYNEKILPIGISATGKEEEIIDIISDYTWSAQEFTERLSDEGKATYTHNIPFCYAIERMQTINSSVANVINNILGTTSAIANAGTEAIKNLIKLKEKTESSINKSQETKKAATASTTASAGGSSSGAAAGAVPTTPGATTVPGQEGAVAAKELAKVVPDKQEGAQEKKEAPASDGGEESSIFKSFLSNKSSILDSLTKLGTDVANVITPRLAEGNLQGTKFLDPWKWLYMTKVTKKKFVFPAFDVNKILSLKNSWGATSGEITNFFEHIEKRFGQVAEFAYGIRQFTDYLPRSSQTLNYDEYNIEHALGFNYNSITGPEYSCRFLLYNTTKKDAWKKNYRFIILFILRNMALRTTMFSYKPPLLYDVIIPGVKHLPLCYVSNIELSALGHVRNMTADNFLKEIVSEAKNTQTLVPVPEAWSMTITFKCLIPDTMNLLLNTTNFPINVTTTTK